MSNRKLILRENHHWWPEGLSKYWINEEGLINVITPDGKAFSSPPKKLGRIAGGHNIILNEPSKLDHTFEGEFDKVNSDFNKIIKTLTETVERHLQDNNSKTTYCVHSYDNAFLNNLCNCLVSLLVRAPMTRDQVVGHINEIGTTMSKKDLKMLSVANMTGKLDQITKRLKGQGKFVILFSNKHEFIYGDGFYHNISMNILKSVLDERILLQITPHLAVMYINPIHYMNEPRLMTLNANRELVMLVNQMVQIYSKDYLFYKSERPTLIKEFLINKHDEVGFNACIENLFNEIPGCIKNL